MSEQSKAEYSPKEIAIFEGVLQLVSEGNRLEELKVADIALKAGVGKGTVYEYFDCKEEIIAKAVKYHLDVAVARVEQVIVRSRDCRTMLFELLDIAAGVFGEKLILLLTESGAVLGEKSGKLLSRQICDSKKLCGERVRDEIIARFEDFKPGQLVPDKEYFGFVFGGVMCSYVQSVSCEAEGSAAFAKSKEYAYNMLMKALS
ncbi:MAG: TetR/AcrR family transcriptional regulator [Oscillospiraceae bacterium]